MDPQDRETYDVKIAYLATTIRGLNPDVVALQEVGDPQCAEDLASAVGDGWQVRLSDHPDGRRIRVGVLSPTPSPSRTRSSTFPTPACRRYPTSTAPPSPGWAAAPFKSMSTSAAACG